MKVAFLACGVLRLELEKVLQQVTAANLFGCEIATSYLQAGLHVDFNQLEAGVMAALKGTTADRIILLYGSKCHPAFHQLLDNTGIITFEQANCIQLLLGDRMQEFDRLGKTFYLTPGWMLCWREIFEQGLHWDEVDIRQSFGFLDRILLLDTGVCEITDEQVLEFFERTRVPIRVEKVGLAVFSGHIITAIERALSNCTFRKQLPPCPAASFPGNMFVLDDAVAAGVDVCPLMPDGMARHFRCQGSAGNQAGDN